MRARDPDVLALNGERGVVEDRPHEVGVAAVAPDEPVAIASHDRRAEDHEPAISASRLMVRAGSSRVGSRGPGSGDEPSGAGWTAPPGQRIVDHCRPW